MTCDICLRSDGINDHFHDCPRGSDWNDKYKNRCAHCGEATSDLADHGPYRCVQPLENPVTDSTPIPELTGPHGLAYFANPNDPTQKDRMRQAAFATLEHGPKAWAYVTEKVAEALKNTPWSKVEIWMTGGGVWTMYATRPEAGEDGLDTDHLVAGPFDSDPSYWDHIEVSVAWARDWEDDYATFIETAFPFPELFAVEGEGEEVRLTDLTHYANQLADAFATVAQRRLTARMAVVIDVRASLDLDRIRPYLPENYTVEPAPDKYFDEGGRFLITGHDVAGWTLDGYVIPRLASGLIAAKEVTFE